MLARVGTRLVVAETGEEDELVALVSDADAILTCFKRVTPAVVRAGTKLQVIGRYGIGVDNIAVDEATRHGIPVTNVPEYCSNEVAEHVLALLLALERGLLAFDRGVRAGDWSLSRGLPIRRVAGRTLGIVGLGRIGRVLAAKAQGIGLRVVVHDPTASDEELGGLEALPLEGLAARSDYVSLHVPLTESTRGLVGEAFLGGMRPGAFLVNCARGGVVDTDALAGALEEGRIGGAALDVFDPEPLPADHRLFTAPRVIATPHVAFYSEESVRELGTRAAENVAAILEGRRPAHVVNPEVLNLPRWAHLDG